MKMPTGIVWCHFVSAIVVCSADISPFERLIQESDYACPPLLLRSSCSNSEYRGLVVFFHGFSACSTQVQKIGTLLIDQCLDVLAPTTPGHGARPVTDCDDPEAHCTVRWGAKQGFDLRGLPTDSSEYMDFVKNINAVVLEERNFRAETTGKAVGEVELAVAGLSFGAALATYAVVSSPNLYTRQLLLNPFFGAGKEDIDEHLVECHEDVRRGSATEKDCVDRLVKEWTQSFGDDSYGQLVEWLVGVPNSAGEFERKLSTRLALVIDDLQGAAGARSLQVSVNKLLDTTQEWSDNCPKIFSETPPRSGFCKFQIKHLLATNAFSLHALVEAYTKAHILTSYPSFPITQILTTERDGMTRNGMNYKLAQQLFSHSQVPSGISMCMYRFRNGTDRRNPAEYWSTENVMPHASIDAADNPGQVMWWEPSLFGKLVAFLTVNSTVSGPETWDGGRDECVGMPLHGDAFDQQPWLRDAVLPDAAPMSASELEPDLFWQSTVLHADVWACAVGCRTESSREKINGFVDCSICDGAQEPEHLLMV